MSTRGAFNYLPSLPDIIKIVKEYAEDKYPDMNLAAATHEQRDKLIAEAGEAGRLVATKNLSVRSLREHSLLLHQSGAQLVPAASKVDFLSADFLHPIELDSEQRTVSQLAYYTELEGIARHLLGPKVAHAWSFGHIVRKSAGDEILGETAGPIKYVHNDFTESYDNVIRNWYTNQPSARARNLRNMLKKFKGLEFSVEEMAKYRIVVLNTWRPITASPLRRDPLAVCDGRTIRREDLQRRQTDIGKKTTDSDDDFALEVYISQHNPDHQWYYVPDFTSKECLVFKTFDSDMDPFIPTLHSAFDLPGQVGAPPRESCEARVICLMERAAAPASRL